MLLVGGGPGTGKTTVANRLAERVGAHVISTDDVRRELQESGDVSGPAGVLGRGLYSPQHVAAVYDEMLRRAHFLMVRGQSVILDGTWRDPHQRATARDVAQETRSVLAEIVCATSAKTAAQRVGRRQPGGASDATPDIAQALGTDAGHWREAAVVDTTRAIADSVRDAEALWRDMV
jgi:hypothetical protein